MLKNREIFVFLDFFMYLCSTIIKNKVMTKEDLIKEVIELTIDQVKEQGWDLLDARTDEAVKMVYDKIKDEI
jgi:hypothetical protein